MSSENGGCEEEGNTSSGSWMGKVARNVRNSVRQEDAHYAQSSRIIRPSSDLFQCIEVRPGH